MQCVVLFREAPKPFLTTFRFQNPVQEWKVPGGDSRVLTTQVSFNRKNEYLLASAKINQVYIWDSRKVGVWDFSSSDRFSFVMLIKANNELRRR